MGLYGDISSCYYTSDFYQLLILDGFYSYIPLVLIVVFNTNILYKIFSKKNLNTNQRRRFSTDVKITFILVADSIIFFILTISHLLFLFYFITEPYLECIWYCLECYSCDQLLCVCFCWRKNSSRIEIFIPI